MLKDQFNRELDYLRLSVTDQCNLRCTYCMPEKGIPLIRPNEIMTQEEIVAIAQAFIDLGVSKIRLTGGEPTLRKDLPEIIKALKSMGVQEIAMTTNAILLEEQAEKYKAAGLDRVNISLDTLKADKFKTITRGGDLDQVFKGIDKALEVGLVPIKINVVLMRGFNDDEIDDLIELTKDPRIHVRFIELMPMGPVADRTDAFMPVSEVIDRYPDLVEQVGHDHSVARRYQMPGYGGTVGFINPVSCNFCADCNRIRVSASGNLRLCLHAGEIGNLKPYISDQNQLKAKIVEWIALKPESHRLDVKSEAGTNMNEIGG